MVKKLPEEQMKGKINVNCTMDEFICVYVDLILLN